MTKLYLPITSEIYIFILLAILYSDLYMTLNLNETGAVDFEKLGY